MEEKIAKYAASFVGGSYIAVGLFIFAIYGVAIVVNGELNSLQSPFMLKVAVVTVLYVVSVFLLATLPGKSAKRRLFSWAYSLIFHSALLLYLGIVQKFGGAVLVLGIAEVLILILSAVGLGAWFNAVSLEKRV